MAALLALAILGFLVTEAGPQEDIRFIAAVQRAAAPIEEKDET